MNSYTRKQYMNKECTHREFYSQFFGDRFPLYVAEYIGKERLLSSKDEHLNDIPLKEWDRLQPIVMSIHGLGGAIKQAGMVGFSLSDIVCVSKEAAKQWINQQQQLNK